MRHRWRPDSGRLTRTLGPIPGPIAITERISVPHSEHLFCQHKLAALCQLPVHSQSLRAPARFDRSRPAVVCTLFILLVALVFANASVPLFFLIASSVIARKRMIHVGATSPSSIRPLFSLSLSLCNNNSPVRPSFSLAVPLSRLLCRNTRRSRESQMRHSRHAPTNRCASLVRIWRSTRCKRKLWLRFSLRTAKKPH